MKKSLLLFILICFSTLIIAQSGSIYSIYFKVDPELTDYFKAENNSRVFFSGWSESEAMPQQLSDSIALKAIEHFAAQLEMPVECCYRQDKNGKNMGTIGVFGVLDGMPANTFKQGKEECSSSTRFISLSVQIYSSGGSSVTMVDKRSKLRPRLQISAKVYDENKVEVMNKKVVLKDFEKLRSITKYYGNVEATSAAVLNPHDIYAMYLMGLEKLMNE